MGNLLIQWSLTMRRKRNAPLNPTHPVCHVAESPSAPLTQHNPSSLFRDHQPSSTSHLSENFLGKSELYLPGLEPQGKFLYYLAITL